MPFIESAAIFGPTARSRQARRASAAAADRL